MDFEIGPAIGAGLIAGGIMIVPLYLGLVMIPSQMKMNLFVLLGTMMIKDRGMAFVAGAMMHAVMSIVFALIHVAFFVAFDIDSALPAWGILFGFVHWMVSGMGMGMMPMMHPLIRKGEMEAPGPFALSFPPMTAIGFLMLHILFGVMVGTFYEVFV